MSVFHPLKTAIEGVLSQDMERNENDNVEITAESIDKLWEQYRSFFVESEE